MAKATSRRSLTLGIARMLSALAPPTAGDDERLAEIESASRARAILDSEPGSAGAGEPGNSVGDKSADATTASQSNASKTEGDVVVTKRDVVIEVDLDLLDGYEWLIWVACAGALIVLGAKVFPRHRK